MAQNQQQDPLRTLYDVVHSEQLYTKSFDEFKTKYSNPEEIDRLYSVVNEMELYTKDLDSFKSKYFPALGKEEEVPTQGLGGTSVTYGQQSSSSLEPSSVEPRNEVVGLPSPKIEGTFREGWEGRWTYDPAGYENYELPESVYRDVFGGDRQRAVEYFSENMPNVLVHLPTEENVTFGTQNIINYETAVPADLEQLSLEEQLASIDPNTLTPEDRLSYDMAAAVNNLIKNNARGQRPATPEERKLLRAREHGERLAESDRDRGVFNTFIGTPIGSVIEGAGREGTRLISGVLGIPELANDLLAGAINSAIGLFGGDPETIPTWEQTYGETPIDKARNYLLGAVERGMEKNSARYGDLGIWESIQAGNIDDAANKLADGLGGILPFTAMLVATGGGGASLMLGTGAVAAGQYTELKDLPMSQEARLLNATINGFSETGTEMLGNKVIIEPLQAAIRNGAGDMATSALTKAFQKVVGKFYPLAAPATEMATEVANLVIGNITAKETGEDPNRNPADGLADVLIVSGVFAGGTQAMTSALTRINNSANLKAAVKLNNQNRDIAVALEDPELSDSERVALEEMYSKNMDTINSYILEEQDRKGKLSPEQQRIVEDMEGQKDRLTELLLSEKTPESVKQSAQGEIDVINEEIDNLIAQGEQTDDTQDQAGVSSEVGEGQEPLQTQPDQSAGQEEAPTGGVLQAQEEVTQREVSEVDRTVFGQAATPEQNVAATRASYERLTEGMTQEQIDADPDLVRMREQIEGASEGVNEYFPPYIQVTEGGRRIITKEDVSSNFPKFANRVTNKFSNTAWDSSDVRDAISWLVSQKPRYAAGMADMIDSLIEAETLLSELGQPAMTISKSELIDKIRKNTQYSSSQKEILSGIVERLHGDAFFDFTDSAVEGSENGYSFSQNLLAARDADAFIHEVGHWGFYNLLSPEERVSFLTYVKDRFYGTRRSLSDDNALSNNTFSDGSVLTTNSTANFSEYFAEQFRQYVLTGQTDSQLRSLFDRFKRYLFEIIELFRNKGYNTDLKPFFDTIISEQAPPVQQPDVFIEPEQSETVNTTLEEIGFTPEESTSFFKGIQTQEGRAKLKQERADRIRQYWQSQQNLGIASQENPEEFARFIKDIAEYAAVSIIDGTIKTARELARAIGVTYDENIQRAFEQAQRIVEPIQQATVTPKRTTTKGQIRKATQGGIQGRVDLSNKDALKSQIQTLNRGIRMARADIKESRKAVSDFIKNMREQGLFRGKVRGRVIGSLLNRVNNANTPSQLQNALDYAEKASRIIEYDQKLSQGSSLQGKAKRLSKRKNMPANVAESLRNVAGINLSYINDIDTFNERLNNLVKAADGVGGRLNTEEMNELARYIDRQVEFTQIANLKDKLLDAGLREEYVDNLNTLDQLKEALVNLPDDSKSTRESKADIQRKFYEDNKAELDNIDESTLTEDEKAALDALKNIDVDQLLSTERGRRLLPLLAVATQNAITTGKFYNVGALIDEHKLQQRSSNQTIVEQVKSTVRVTKRWMNKVRKEGATTFGQIDAILKDRKKVGAFMELTGLDDYQKAYVRATKRVRDVLDRFNNLMEKHDKSLRNNPVERFLLGIYLDLNNRKASWTADEVAEQFNARKKAIEDSIERLEKQMGQDENLRKEKQTYLDNLKEAYNHVAPLASSEEIFDILSTASKEVANFMRTEFQAIRGGLQTNAEVWNNTIFEGDWGDTYFPRNYIRMNPNINVSENSQQALDNLAEGNVYSSTNGSIRGGETTGAKQARTLEGSQLPEDSYIDLDAVARFRQAIKSSIYDVETQPARRYVARAMGSMRVQEIFGDVTPLNVMRRAAEQRIARDAAGAVAMDSTSPFGQIMDGVQQLSVTLALGGAGQFVKQSVPQIADLTLRLGLNNLGLIGQSIDLLINHQDIVRELMKDSPITLREMDRLETQPDALSQKEKRALEELLGKHLGKAGKAMTATMRLSMKPLTLADLSATQIAWVANYLHYLKKDGGKNAIKLDALRKPNKSAQSYATFQTEILANVSNPSDKPKLYKDVGGKIMMALMPYASFSFNSKMELATNLGKLSDWGSMSNDERLQLSRNIGGNLMAIVSYQLIGQWIRNLMIYSAYQGFMALIANSGDLNDDEEKALEEVLTATRDDLITRNNENSWDYMLEDLLFGGIAQQYTGPWVEAIKQLSSKVGIGGEYKPRYQQTEWYDSLGGFGAIPRAATSFYNNFNEWILTDNEWRIRKYAMEDEFGEKFIVPLDYQGINRPLFSRLGYGFATLANATSLMGGSLQEVGAITRRIPRLVNEAERELIKHQTKGRVRGTDVKQEFVELERLKKIKVAGVEQELTPEQYEKVLKVRKDFVNSLVYSDKMTEDAGASVDIDRTTRNALGISIGEPLTIEKLKELAYNYANSYAIANFGDFEKISKEARKKQQDKVDFIMNSAEIYRKAMQGTRKVKGEDDN